MEDVNISIYRASVVREGSTPASPGFVVSDGQNPVDPSGSGQNHLPVTIATAATGLSITESQVLGGAGTTGQYIRGDGSLADFPSSSGGGSSVSYYLNGSVAQGTIGGVAYKELNKVPILGAGTDFTINADGYIASFITDAGDPNLIEIPGGNWNFETYFSASSSGGSPSFYVELYKVNSGGTATLIASNSGFPELIAFGTNIISYFSTLAVPTTTLALTDRLAIRYYVTHSGRTITLHTEDNHLCQIITTFTTGITALNGLTAQVQNFAVGTSGTDFNIASATATHTFNLPTASATNRGALSSADWSTFNGKENAITAGTTAQYFRGDKTFQTLNTAAVPELTNLYYTEARVNANANVAANTAARHNAVTLGTANGLSLSTQVLSLGLASAGVTGALSGTDWSTFNSKQNALTNPVTGTGTTNTLPKFTGSTTIGNSLFTDNGTNGGFGGANYSSGTDVRSFNISAPLYAGLGFWANNVATCNIFSYGVTGNLLINADPTNVFADTKIGLIIDGTERFAIFNNGNVSIANSPTDNGAKLQVSGTISVTNSTADNNSGTILNTSTTGYGLRVSGGQSGDNTTRYAFRVSDYQNNPLFSVYGGGAATFSSSVTAKSMKIENTGVPAFLYFNNTSAPASNYIALGSGANELYFQVNGADRIVIKDNGNVGIGTPTPPRRLSVHNESGGAAISLATNLTGTTQNIFLVGNTGSGVNDGYMQLYDNGVAKVSIAANASRGGATYFNSGGNVLIGTTTDNGARLYITGGLVSTMLSLRSNNGTATNINFTSESPAGSTDNYTINHTMVHGSGGGYRIEHNVSSRWIRMIAGTGGVELAGGATSWASISDIRVKNIIGNIENSLDAIKSLSAIKYTLKTDITNKTRVGLIAQEVQKVLPECVEVDQNGMLSVRYTELIPMMVQAIKELNEKIK